MLGHLIFRRTWLCNMLIFFSLWLEHSLIYRTVLVKRVGKLSSLSLVRAQWNSDPPLHLLWEYIYLVYISATNGNTCFFTLNSQCKFIYVRDLMRFFKSVLYVMLNVWVYVQDCVWDTYYISSNPMQSRRRILRVSLGMWPVPPK